MHLQDRREAIIISASSSYACQVDGAEHKYFLVSTYGCLSHGLNDLSAKCQVGGLIKVSIGECRIPEGEQDVSPAARRRGLSHPYHSSELRSATKHGRLQESH